MSDNKLVKTIMDAATLTGIGWIAKKVVKENFTADPSTNVMNYAKFTAVMAGSVALKQYLEDQNILSESGLKNYLSIKWPALRCDVIGGAVLNATAFTGDNYLENFLAGDNGQATLDKKTWHDKALEAYQATKAIYSRKRTQLLDWVETNREIKEHAKQNFTNTD